MNDDQRSKMRAIRGTPEARRKTAEASKERWGDPIQRAKIVRALSETLKAPEQRRRLQVQGRAPMAPETKIKMSQILTGRPISDETRERMSASAKAAWMKRGCDPGKKRGRHREVYERAYGEDGPCYFCKEQLNLLDGHIHHIDGDRSNNDHLNLSLAHPDCHFDFHFPNRRWKREARKEGGEGAA